MRWRRMRSIKKWKKQKVKKVVSQPEINSKVIIFGVVFHTIVDVFIPFSFSSQLQFGLAGEAV